MLKADELFLAMTVVAASLDSRYFGLVSGADILGRVRPIVVLGPGSSAWFPDVQGEDLVLSDNDGRKAR